MIPNRAVFRRVADCPTESWRNDETGHVDWWTLFSADRTPTSALTVGVAEVPVGAPRPPRGHTHEQAEVYFFLSGAGEVVIEGVPTPVIAGDAVFIPGNVEHMSVNTGEVPLRLLYFFAADSFAEILYKFPGRDEHT